MFKLLILGGSQESCNIIKKAKEMNIYTVVTDWYDEEHSPAKKICDKAYNISIADVDEVVEMIKKEKINGVITGFTDSYLEYYFKICNKADLFCYGTLEQFMIGTNKAKFKQICQENDINVIQEYDILNDKDNIKYPVIIKPVDNSGSRGIYRCDSEENLLNLYNESIKYSPSKQVIIEKYQTGKHVNIYYTIIDGKPILSAMADRFIYFPDKFVAPQPNGLIHPSRYLNNYLKDMDLKVKKMFENLDIKNGVVFIQAFWENNEFYIYEMGYRLNGGSTFYLIDKCCGYNQLKMLIDFSITGKMLDIKENICCLEKPQFNGKIGFNLVVSANKGIIAEIYGIDEIKKKKEVLNVIQMHSTGENLDSNGTTKQIFAYILIVTENIQKLKKVIKDIEEKLSVIDKDGNEMITNWFDTSNLKDY